MSRVKFYREYLNEFLQIRLRPESSDFLDSQHSKVSSTTRINCIRHELRIKSFLGVISEFNFFQNALRFILWFTDSVDLISFSFITFVDIKSHWKFIAITNSRSTNYSKHFEFSKTPHAEGFIKFSKLINLKSIPTARESRVSSKFTSSMTSPHGSTDLGKASPIK